jgi:hypothetical protein
MSRAPYSSDFLFPGSSTLHWAYRFNSSIRNMTENLTCETHCGRDDRVPYQPRRMSKECHKLLHLSSCYTCMANLSWISETLINDTRLDNTNAMIAIYCDGQSDILSETLGLIRCALEAVKQTRRCRSKSRQCRQRKPVRFYNRAGLNHSPHPYTLQ